MCRQKWEADSVHAQCSVVLNTHTKLTKSVAPKHALAWRSKQAHVEYPPHATPVSSTTTTNGIVVCMALVWTLTHVIYKQTCVSTDAHNQYGWVSWPPECVNLLSKQIITLILTRADRLEPVSGYSWFNTGKERGRGGERTSWNRGQGPNKSIH